MTVATPAYRRLAEGLQRHRRALGYGAKGCRLYYLQASELLAFLEAERGVREIERVSASDVEAYYKWLSVRPSHNGAGALTEAAQGSHVRVCRDLFAWLVAAGALAVDPASGAPWSGGREVAGERHLLTQGEVAELYRACDSARERALVSLAYGCGLRSAEVEACDVGDVRLRESLLVVRSGKGAQRRAVPLSDGVVRDLEAYIYEERSWWESFGESPTAALVVNDQGRRMRTYTFNKVLGQVSERAGIEPAVTCHVLRHAIATHLLERGMATEQVRQFLGHRHLVTTQIYTHVSAALVAGLIRDPGGASASDEEE